MQKHHKDLYDELVAHEEERKNSSSAKRLITGGMYTHDLE